MQGSVVYASKATLKNLKSYEGTERGRRKEQEQQQKLFWAQVPCGLHTKLASQLLYSGYFPQYLLLHNCKYCTNYTR